ncbi:hypothetical protein ACPW7J_08275 [Ihubacter sp. rT4E-8]|uniref:hypothetical protein n=1 Tax=Ihubacter sp. rT4E-8 TaxID=3242369 RepID=UPI003CF2F415
MEHKKFLIGLLLAVSILIVFFMIDLCGIEFFLFLCFPILVSLLGIALVCIGRQRKKKHMRFRAFYVLGGIMAFFPLELYLLVWLAIFLFLSPEHVVIN